MSRSWARYALERYSMLKKWREYARIVARACRDTLASSCLHVYVVGGAAEDRLTVLSDIDIVVVVDDPKLKSLEVLLAIKRRAEELGLPMEIPIDLKILTQDELKELMDRKIYRRAIEIALHDC